MGTIRHHAMCVTAHQSEHADQAFAEVHKKAIELFGEMTTGATASAINGYQSFFIAPDGSNEGWDISDDYDAKRREFAVFIRSFAYYDGSNVIRFVDVFYGDDEGEAAAVRWN